MLPHILADECDVADMITNLSSNLSNSVGKIMESGFSAISNLDTIDDNSATSNKVTNNPNMTATFTNYGKFHLYSMYLCLISSNIYVYTCDINHT